MTAYYLLNILSRIHPQQANLSTGYFPVHTLDNISAHLQTKYFEHCTFESKGKKDSIL